ncbi:MAG: hypothetical protein ACWGP1_15655, partial [Syntrophobacteria bacterium]
MLNKLNQIKETGLAALAGVENEDALNQWKVTYLGRSSAIMDVFKNMGSVPKQERGDLGRSRRNIGTFLKRSLQKFCRPRTADHTTLGKGDDLDVDDVVGWVGGGLEKDH